MAPKAAVHLDLGQLRWGRIAPKAENRGAPNNWMMLGPEQNMGMADREAKAKSSMSERIDAFG